jgi:hypothetical protein
MTALYLHSSAKLLAAALLGFITGFVMLKSDLIWRRSVFGIFLLKDGRLIKTFLLYILLGTLGFFLLRRMGVVEIHSVQGYFWSSIMGGMLGGIGMVLCGFAPATSITAFSCGRLYAIWTIIGMILAVPCVKHANSFLSKTVYSWGDRMLNDAQPMRFLSLNNPAFYIVVISAFLIFLIHFTIGDKE